MRGFFIFFSLVFLLQANIFADNKWIESGFWFGSNDFLRQDATFLTNISTRIVGGFNFSFYKLEKQNKVYSFRLPLNYFIYRGFTFSIKPFYYPENGNKMSAYGSRFSIVHHSQNDINEFATDYTLSFAFEKQKFSQEYFSNKSLEMQVEQNFYDEFFLAFEAATLINSEGSLSSIKRYSEISDLISLNAFGFINDRVYNNLGVRIARSFKPDYDSYIYFGMDRLNSKHSDYNSYLLGLRINFVEKNFFDFTYNYLDSKSFENKKYYKISIGVFF